MALDEPTDTDKKFDVDGFTYIVNETFLEKAQPIKVDFVNYGFKLDSALTFSPAAGGACSACSSSKGGCG